MAPLSYGDRFHYALVSSSGQLGIAHGTVQWAVVGIGDPAKVWFESESGAVGGDVLAGDTLYIVTKGHLGAKRYLVKRLIGDTMKWSEVRGDSFVIKGAVTQHGHPVQVGETVTFADGRAFVGLGANNFVAYDGTALPFVANTG